VLEEAASIGSSRGDRCADLRALAGRPGRAAVALSTPRASLTSFKRSAGLAPSFSGMTLDRAVTVRADASLVARALEQPTTRFVGASREGVLLDHGTPQALIRRSPGPLTARHVNAAEPILLGLEAGAALFAVDLDTLDQSALAGFTQGARIVGLREAGSVLSRPEGGLAAYLVALLNWHRRHRFCANCGAGTTPAEAGYSRRCASCGAAHFPRTDPVVIMLVEHAGRLLLGRHAGWPPGQYSALAGFVSPGESLEEAVVREVREESGIEVHDPRFVTSQPWPFPTSLMLGFEARSEGGEPVPHDGELEDVRWFTPEVIRAALAAGSSELVLPPSVSIARFLVERWVANADAGAPDLDGVTRRLQEAP
jgi:NAD+ diphosphatase